MKKAIMAVACCLVFVFTQAYAGNWYQGEITFLGVGYDGNTVAFKLSGWSRNDCTCYPTWPTYMCLDRSRQSFKEEMALLLSAKARGTTVRANILESSCFVTAIYE